MAFKLMPGLCAYCRVSGQTKFNIVPITIYWIIILVCGRRLIDTGTACIFKRVCVCAKVCVIPDPSSGCGQNSGPEGRFKNIVSVALVIPHCVDFRFTNYSLPK